MLKIYSGLESGMGFANIHHHPPPLWPSVWPWSDICYFPLRSVGPEWSCGQMRSQGSDSSWCLERQRPGDVWWIACDHPTYSSCYLRVCLTIVQEGSSTFTRHRPKMACYLFSLSQWAKNAFYTGTFEIDLAIRKPDFESQLSNMLLVQKELDYSH